MEEVSSDEDVYEVESIVDSVVSGDRVFYRVRWKNYGQEGDTWEPEANLLSCEDLLTNYNRTQAEKTSGLTLSGDVVTAGDSESDTDKSQQDRKDTKSKKSDKKNIGRPKKVKLEPTGVKQTRKLIKTFSTSSSSDSEEPPPLKDNFWEKLQEGKIDVFATDLYSKVKSRHPPQKETDTKIKTPQDGKSRKSMSKKKPAKIDAKPSAGEIKVGKQPKDRKSTFDKQKACKDDASKSRSKYKKEGKIHKTSIDLTEQNVEKSSSHHVVLEYLEEEIKSTSNGKVKPEKQPTKAPKDSAVKKASNEESVEIDGKEIALQAEAIGPEKMDFIDSPASVELDDIGGTVPDEDLLTENREKPSNVKKITLPEIDVTAVDRPIQMEQDTKHNDKPMSPESENTNQSVQQNEEKVAEPAKSRGAFEVFDAFTAHLRQSDVATSERMIQRKVKAKKSKTSRTTPSIADKDKIVEGKHKSIYSTKPSSVDAVDRSMKAQKSRIDMAEELQQDCIPEMSEFLKIHVTFKLDQITLKEIMHHENGEPQCRLDKDITNAEFRQHIRSNNFEIVYEALKSKTMMYNLEHTDSVWMTQLMVAAAAGYDEIVKILAHHGAKVNARTKNGNTALMFAAEKGYDIVCRILIAYGAYVNLQTTAGETALMKAAKNGYTIIVRCLLQAGADPITKSVHGNTALELAERSGHSLLSILIKDHEASISQQVNDCIKKECDLLGIKTIGLPILAPRSYNIRECPLIHIAFNSVLQNVPPNQGLILFAVHGMITSGLSIKCRMRGPCHVIAVTMNNFVMEPFMPGKTSSEESMHFMTNLIWKTGQNSVKLFMTQDPLSREKLFVSIFQCGLVA